MSDVRGATRPAGGARPLDLTLYLVTDTRLCVERGVVGTAMLAVHNGATAVQLRDPDATARDLVDVGQRLRAALAGTGVPVLVDDRADIAFAIGADGVHVGQDDLPATAARALLGRSVYIGLSVRTAEQAAAAARLPAHTVDYLGIGPVFAQTTKPGAGAAIGLDALAGVVAATTLPTVAIGGITADNAAAVRAAGVSGIAVVSAICGQPDPAAATRALLPGGYRPPNRPAATEPA